MDTESGRGTPDEPADEWFPTVSAGPGGADAVPPQQPPAFPPSQPQMPGAGGPPQQGFPAGPPPGFPGGQTPPPAGQQPAAGRQQTAGPGAEGAASAGPFSPPQQGPTDLFGQPQQPAADPFAQQPATGPFAAQQPATGPFAVPQQGATDPFGQPQQGTSDLFTAPQNDLFGPPPQGPSDLFGAPTPAGPLRPASSGLPWKAILSGVGVLVVVGGIVAAVVLGTGKNNPSPTPNPTAATGSPLISGETATAAPIDACKGLPGTVLKNDGGQDTPMNVVAALQHAYYVTRDAQAVTRLYAPNVLAPDAIKGIADFIEKIPQGTKYCVSAVQKPAPPAPPGQQPQISVDYDVNEVQPGASTPIHYAMTLTVSPTAPYTIVGLGSR